LTSIYPSRRAVFVAALGIPLSLAAAIAAPGLWAAGLGWSLLALLLIALDWALGASARRLAVNADLPDVLGVGRAGTAAFSLAFDGKAPGGVELELDGNERFSVSPGRRMLATEGNGLSASFQLTPLRRGEGRLETLWLRWTGPLGLTWIQHAHPLSRTVPVVPDVQSVREEAIRLFQRDNNAGLQFQLERGRGSEFHALRDFQIGHDPRQLDWKQSARHNALIVKEFRVEQNQHIVVALDTGRLMSEPLHDQPRLDRALQAFLLLAFVGLKLGDRVGLYAFDSQPRLRSGSVAGVRAFPTLQRLAATLDYSDQETNFTLGLTQLAGDLEHRSVIVLFSDFSDTTSAELMLENVAHLLKRHTVLFVVFRDEELETMRRAEPQTSRDASCAVIADLLLKEREVVMARLRQLGVEVVDTPADRLNAGLINAYLALKQRIRLQP
jgi:uncharacterized protein (DUF58 family)